MFVSIHPDGSVGFDGMEFETRRCHGNNMWSLMLREHDGWRNVCLISSAETPFRWVSEFIGSNAADVSGFRRVLLNKTLPR
jgi:hypothetical protein